MRSLRTPISSLWPAVAAFLTIAVVLSLSWTTWHPGAQGSTTVGPSPADAYVAVGMTTTVFIYVTDVQDLYGADVQLAFDTSLVEVVDADPGTPGVQIELLSDFLSPDWPIKNEADNKKGTIWYAVTQLNPSEPVSGSGPLAAIEFRGLAVGSSPITVTSQKLADRHGITIPATAQDGQITVGVATSTPTPTQTPGPAPTATPTPFPILYQLRLFPVFKNAPAP
jgi:hypothetical protein